MNLIWHIFKKDARCLRWALVGWLGLYVAQMICALVPPDDGVGMASTAGIATWAGNIILPIVTYMLVMSLVQDDPVASDVSFWIARPIAGARLLAAKLLGIVLLLWLLPVVVSLPWWLWHGYGLKELGLASVRIGGTQAIITLMALPIAALSEKSGKFLAITLGALLVSMIAAITFAQISAGTDAKKLSAGVIESRGWLITGITFVALTVMTAHQFLTRRTMRSWIMAGSAFVAVFAILLYWRWDFSSQFKRDKSEVWNASLEARLAAARLSSIRQPARAPKVGKLTSAIFVRYEFNGLPAPYVATVQSATQTLTWPDQTVTAANRGGLSIDTMIRRDQPWAEALALVTGKPAPTVKPGYASFELPDQTVAERLVRETPAYRCEIRGTVWTPKVVVELPLHVGAALARRGFGVEIEAVDLFSDLQVNVSLREHTPEFVTKDRPLALPTSGLNFLRVPTVYFLVNRQRPGVLCASPGRREDISSVGTVRKFQQRLVFSPLRQAAAPVPTDLDAWLKDAVLVKVVYQREGAFHRMIETPHLEVEVAPTPKP